MPVMGAARGNESHRWSYDNKTGGKNRRSRLDRRVRSSYALNMYLLSKQNGRAELPGVRLVSYYNAGNAAGNFGGPLAPLFIGVAADRLSSVLAA